MAYNKTHSKKKENQKITHALAIMLAVLLGILLVVVIWMVWRYSGVGEKVLFKVGNLSVTEKQFTAYTKAAEKYNISSKAVRGELITYLKNKQVVDSEKIAMPGVFLDTYEDAERSKTVKDVQTAQRAEDSSPNLWIDIKAYNAFFLARMEESNAGVGIVMYDFPYSRVSSGDTTYDTSATVRQQAEAVRTDLLSHKNDQSALDEAFRYGKMSNISLSGAVFVRNTGGIVEPGGSAMRDGPLEASVIIPLIKNARLGVSDIHDVEGRGYFFFDVKYIQKDDPAMKARLQSKINKIRVVEYDR